MADHFQVALERTLKIEGGHSFDPKDYGGETYMGISRTYWPNWEGWYFVDKAQDKTKLIRIAVEALYRTHFWERMQGDKLSIVSPEVAYEVFDTAVNLDVPDAVRFLQTALNMQRLATKAFSEMVVDGRLGPKTIIALSLYLSTEPGDPDSNEKILLNCMNGEQYISYKGNPRHPYFRGWFLRV